MNKKVILGVILLVILVIGGYFVFNRDYKGTQESNTSNTNTTTNTIPVENNANSSKTYSNSQYGFSIDYPQNYEIYNTNTSNGYTLTLVDKSKVFPNSDVKNLILVEARSAKNEVSFDSYIKKYPLLDSNTNKAYTFTPRIINGKTFYYTLTERFEGTLSFEYCIINNNNVLCFHSISNGVAWSDENLNVEADSTHVALKKMLESLKFNLVGKVSDKSIITLVSPNGGEVFKPGDNMKIFWNNSVGSSNIKLMIVAGKVSDGHYTNNGSMATTRGYEIYRGIDNGVFNFIVPKEYPHAGNWLIRIESEGGAIDYSDEYFTIVK